MQKNIVFLNNARNAATITFNNRDSSDSETEVSFNFASRNSKKRQRTIMSTPEDEDAFFKKLTNHLDKKTDELHLKLSLQLAPIQSQVNSNTSNIIEIQKAVSRLEENYNSGIQLGSSRRAGNEKLKEEKYLISRRSGRFWPVPGKNEWGHREFFPVDHGKKKGHGCPMD